MTNLATLLAASAHTYGDRPAVRQDDTVLSYAQLDAACARVAALLRTAGVGPGDRVALCLPNTPTSRSPTTESCAPAVSWCRSIPC